MSVKCVFFDMRRNDKRLLDEIFKKDSPDLLYLAAVEHSQRMDIEELMVQRKKYKCLTWVDDYNSSGLACYSKKDIVENGYFDTHGEFFIAVKLKDSGICVVGILPGNNSIEPTWHHKRHMANIYDYYVGSDSKPIFVAQFNENDECRNNSAVNLFEYSKKKGLFRFTDSEEEHCKYRGFFLDLGSDGSGLREIPIDQIPTDSGYCYPILLSIR